MKKITILILLTFVAALTFGIINAQDKTNSCEHTANEFRCVKFIKNYDADTITVNIPNVHPFIGNKMSVRIFGVDAPEIKGANNCEKDASRTAKKLVENLLKNAKRIDLVNVKKDKYFRILADVVVDGRDVKGILLKNHLAYEYYGGTKEKKDWCKFTKTNDSQSRDIATKK